VKAFHKLLQDLCVKHGVSYDALKAQCDSYFLLPHRNETRGIGGLFYDTMSEDFEAAKAFAVALGDCFLPLYGLFVNNAKMSFTQAQREFQLYRRGRYVEFNLLYDRGTKFGLSSEGRIESILVSLPATVHYCYDYNPPRGSREEYLYLHFLRPQPWLELTAEDDARMKSPPNYVTSFQAQAQTMPSDGAGPASRGGVKSGGSSGSDSRVPRGGPSTEPEGHFGSLTQVTAVVAGAAAIAGVLRYLRA
jgi:coproporphyrinogen III oxidase